jgi:hypothetical protein
MRYRSARKERRMRRKDLFYAVGAATLTATASVLAAILPLRAFRNDLI